MVTLFILIGLQASGKSTEAERIRRANPGSKIIATDQLRLENPTLNEKDIFDKFYRDIRSNLEKDVDVIVDATNINIESRKRLFDSINKGGKMYDKCIGILVNTPVNECVFRLVDRNKSSYQPKIEIGAIYRTVAKFQFPLKPEGFDEIRVTNTENTVGEFIKAAKAAEISFHHNDKYHGKESLADHNDNVLNNLIKLGYKKTDIELAVLLHDVGKPVVVKPNKKFPEFLCYHNHENIGAYNFLVNMDQEAFEKYQFELFTCNFHMFPITAFGKWEEFKNQYRGIFSEEQFEFIEDFNAADEGDIFKYKKDAQVSA